MNGVALYQKTQPTDLLIQRHSDLVRRIAHHLSLRLPANIQLDDLIQAGMIGLLEAARNYDGSKGASFETFAGIRIRGAMLDEARRQDWQPRSNYRNSRRVSEAIQAIEQETGRDANDAEVATRLDISLEEYHHILRDLNTGRLLGIEDLGVSEDAIEPTQDAPVAEPYSYVQKDHFYRALGEEIGRLPEREALVLSLYYDEELNLKEIGAVLGVSESRVSQIHSQAMHRLRARLGDWRDSRLVR